MSTTITQSKSCENCGTTVRTVADRAYCSTSCQKEYAFKLVREMDDNHAWCPTCGKDGFDCIRTMLYHHNKKHNFKLHRTKICENCSGIFRPKNSSNPNRFCSESCFGDFHHLGYTELDCQNCSNTFEKKTSIVRAMIQHYNKPPQYCADCNKGWNNHTDGFHESPVYYRWQKKVREKYGNVCQECESTKHTSAHHITPVHEEPALAARVDNGTILCANCHANKHPEMSAELFKPSPPTNQNP